VARPRSGAAGTGNRTNRRLGRSSWSAGCSARIDPGQYQLISPADGPDSNTLVVLCRTDGNRARPAATVISTESQSTNPPKPRRATCACPLVTFPHPVTLDLGPGCLAGARAIITCPLSAEAAATCSSGQRAVKCIRDDWTSVGAWNGRPRSPPGSRRTSPFSCTLFQVPQNSTLAIITPPSSVGCSIPSYVAPRASMKTGHSGSHGRPASRAPIMSICTPPRNWPLSSLVGRGQTWLDGVWRGSRSCTAGGGDAANVSVGSPQATWVVDFTGVPGVCYGSTSPHGLALGSGAGGAGGGRRPARHTSGRRA